MTDQFPQGSNNPHGAQAPKPSVERLQLIADFANDWEFWLGPDGSLLYNSPSCERVTGRPAQAFFADPELLAKIVVPEDHFVFEHHLTEKLNSLETCSISFRILMPNGERRWIGQISQPVIDHDGQQIGRRASNRDITAARQAEQNLRYQAVLFNNLIDAVIASDKNFCITAWNAAAEAMYGWKAEEVLGCNGLEIMQTVFPEVDKARMLETITKNGSYRGEATQVRKDGQRIQVEVASIAMYDFSGKVSGYLSVNRDISQRKRSEETLAIQAAILENLQDAVIGLDAQLMVNYWNRSAEKLYKWSKAEAQGKPVLQLTGAEAEKQGRHELLQQLQQTGEYTGIAVHHTRDAKHLKVEMHVKAVRDQNGQVLCYILTVREVSQRQAPVSF